MLEADLRRWQHRREQGRLGRSADAEAEPRGDSGPQDTEVSSVLRTPGPDGGSRLGKAVERRHRRKVQRGAASRILSTQGSFVPGLRGSGHQLVRVPKNEPVQAGSVGTRPNDRSSGSFRFCIFYLLFYV